MTPQLTQQPHQATDAARRIQRAIPRYLLDEQVGFALIVWAGFLLFVIIATTSVTYIVPSLLNYDAPPVESSIWDQAAQIAQWFTLFIGVYAGWSVMPMYITHGRTRREYMRHVVVFVAIYAAAVAILVTATFGLEAILYRITGWPQEVKPDQLFSGALQLHLIALQYWLVIALWTVAGIFIAAAWYRNAILGGVAIVVSIGLGTLSGLAFTGDWGPLTHL